MSNDLSVKCKQVILDEKKTMECWPSRCPPKIRNSIMGAVAIFVLISGILLVVKELAIAVAIIGGIVFFATLALADYASPDMGVSTGEMRSAISATIIVVYIVVVVLSLGGKFTYTDSKIIESFSAVVMTVVGFYFGSKGAIELFKIYKGERKD